MPRLLPQTDPGSTPARPTDASSLMAPVLGAQQVADSKHPSVHKELRELVTFRGPVDSVYKNAPAKVALDNGRGACRRFCLVWLAARSACTQFCEASVQACACWSVGRHRGWKASSQACAFLPLRCGTQGTLLKGCRCTAVLTSLVALPHPLAGAVAMSSSNWPEIVVWTPWTAMEACYK